MSSNRALPDLVARLKLDPGDLTKADAAVKVMDRSIQGAASTSAAGLRRIQAETGNTHANLARLGTAFEATRGAMDRTTGSVTGLVGPLLGITGVVGTTYTALDKVIIPAAGFEQQMTKLTGTAGESRGVLKSVSDGILQMAGEVGYAADQLADGMYLVESAGFHGSAGLNVLRSSAMAAKAENADLATVANAVTTALNAYGLGADKAAHVTDVLLTATSQGKMTFQDLAGSLDQVLPSASAARIGLNEVAAAIATQTAQGTPAAVAATNLQYAIKGLEVTTSTSGAAIEALGVKSTRFSNELVTKGLLPTLNDLTTVVGKKFPEGSAAYDAAISNILGNQEGLNAVLQLSGVHAGTFAGDLAGMGAAAGKTKSSFDEMMDTTGGKWSKFTAGLQADAVRVGTVALPALDKLIDSLSGRVSPLLDKLAPAAGAAIAGAGQVATGRRNLGQAVMPVLESLGMKPEDAAKIAGPITDMAAQVGPTLQRLGQDLRNIGPPLLAIGREAADVLVPALRAAGPPALQLGETLASAIAPALGFVAQHMNVIAPILGTVVGLWVAWNVGLAVTKAIEMAQMAAQFVGGLIAIASKVGLSTVAQWAWNVAMEANPIGLIIIGIAALIVVIVLVVTHWNQVVAVLGVVWHWLSTVALGFLEHIPIIGSVVLAIVWLVGHWNSVIAVVKDVINWFGHAGDAFSALGTLAHKIADGIGGAFSAVSGAVHDALHGVAHVIDTFDSLVDSAPILGGMVGHLPTNLEAFAEGAIVTRPTLGVFGEAGPEALIPLSGGQRALDLWAQAGEMLGLHGLGGAIPSTGALAGQCVVAVEDWLGTHWPVALAKQLTAYVNSSTAKAGEVAVFTGGAAGHAALVLGPGNGFSWPVVDSNWGGDERVQYHTLDRDTYGFAGFIDTGARNVKGLFPGLGGIVDGFIDRAVGGLGGWSGSFAKALVGRAAHALPVFDEGGIWPSGTLGANLSGRAEYVLTRDQMAGLAGGSAKGDVHIHISGQGLNAEQVAMAVDRRVAARLTAT